MYRKDKDAFNLGLSILHTFASSKTQNVNQVEPGPDSYKISQDCLLIRWPRYLYFSQGKLGILCSDFNWHSCIAICMLN